MPGLLFNTTPMPSKPTTNPTPAPMQVTSDVVCVIHHETASDFLLAAGATLQRFEVGGNMVLPYALERQAAEGMGSRIPGASDSLRWWREHLAELLSQPPPQADVPLMVPPAREFYFMSVWTIRNRAPALDIAVACVARKPLFLFSPLRKSPSLGDYMTSRVSALVARMIEVIPSRRVFSMFGPTHLVRPLATEWSRRTGHAIEAEPYYWANYTFCTLETFTGAIPLPFSHRVRLAEERHIRQAAELCKEFADDSVIFPLSIEAALEEAAALVSKRQLYVYEIIDPVTGNFEVTTIVAVTRVTNDVAAISKVYTGPRWRKRGFAQTIVAAVTEEVLRRKGRAVLFVAHGNLGAASVYGRVGFAGVGANPRQPEVEDWIELGFKNTDRGHW